MPLLQAWQEQKAKTREDEETAAKAAAEIAGKWSLEDEEEDEQPAGTGAADGIDDEIDPLDAFMAENTAQQASAVLRDEEQAAEEQAAPHVGDEDVDPLDAFMAAEVEPVVQQADPNAASDQRAEPPVKVESTIVKAEEVKAEGGGENGIVGPVAPATRAAKPPRRRPRYYDSESSTGSIASEDEQSSDDEVSLLTILAVAQ